MLENSLIRVILGGTEDKDEAHTHLPVSVVTFQRQTWRSRLGFRWDLYTAKITPCQ